MSRHLTATEFTDAIDGALEPARRAHLDQCGACRDQRDQIAALQQLATAATGEGDVPEPSPLFWDHFSARVHAAVADEPIAELSWWQRVWRPALGIGVALAAAVMVVVLRMPGSTPMPATPAATASLAPADDDTSWKALDLPRDDEAWDVVVAMASELSADDLHGVVHATSSSAVPLDDLTAAEREAFVKLLRQEMGGLE